MASGSTAGLKGGTHVVSARFGGTSNFDTSASNTVTQIVTKKATTSRLTTSANPRTFGRSLTFKDSVWGSAPDGGKVLFKIDGAPAGDSLAINSNGVATMSTTTLGIGTHLIRAYYGGTANFDTSSSNIITQVIRPDSFTIIATAGLNGLLAPSGAVLVARGSTQQFTITPNLGYHLDSLLVDGSRVDSTTSYTFFAIAANHRIRAVFAINTYTITATGGPNGTVTPSGTLIVDWGTSQSFAITGNTGFKVSNVLVDGVSVGRVTTYAFNNVTSDHTISATFEVSFAYSNRYRTFSADSIPFERDNRGKLGKYVFRKPDKVEFSFVVRNDSAGVNGLHAEFGIAIDTSRPFFTVPHSTISTTDVKMKKWNFTFDTLLTLGEQVRVSGFGKSPKLQSVSSYHWTKQGVPNG